jgi:hypothetical protein
LKLFTSVVVTCCVLLGNVGAVSESKTPILRFSIYGVTPKDSPVRIVNFVYDGDDLQLTLLNQTETVVVAAVIAGRLTAPESCNDRDEPAAEISAPRLEPLNIPAHESITTLKPGSSIRGSSLVKVAQMQKLAGAQVQLQVTEVRLADGTTWRPHPDPRLPTGRPTAQFDSALEEVDAAMCQSRDSVLHALASITGTRSNSEQVHLTSSNITVQGQSFPHLDLECRLEGSVAICPSH